MKDTQADAMREVVARGMWHQQIEACGHTEGEAALVSGDDWHQYLPIADEALLAARAEGERRGIERAWQPIETAPKDGTRILGSAGDCVEVIYWARDGWFNQSAEISMWRVWPPTHWQPLPAPPVPEHERSE